MAISYDEPITFGSEGSVGRLNPTGIDLSESGPQSWSIAQIVEMDLQFVFIRADIVMELEVTPFIVPGQVPVQQAFLFIGGQFVGFFSATGYVRRSFRIARSAISGRIMRLSIVIPTAASPASLQMSDDQRELGLCFTAVTFSSAK